jgi:SAM-dependent methyltransferase
MPQADRWLDATWPRVRDRLPAPPARVLELGCGAVGGHVPRLRAAGYDAIGVDPAAPDGEDYRRVDFERYDADSAFDAVVASTSLHHVADPAAVLDRIAGILGRGGRVVVIEWHWEAFDEPTAEWAFRRLGPGHDANWLRGHRDGWAASGLPWSAYLGGWADGHGIHPALELLRLLEERFPLEAPPVYGPYLFADLGTTSEEEEQGAIATGEISATRVEVVGRRM